MEHNEYYFGYEQQPHQIIEKEMLPAISFECNDMDYIKNSSAVAIPYAVTKYDIITRAKAGKMTNGTTVPVTMEQKNEEAKNTEDAILERMTREMGINPKNYTRDELESARMVYEQTRKPVTVQVEESQQDTTILIQKLRDLVITFEKKLHEYLDPHIPYVLREKDNYLLERMLFGETGYKEYIRSIENKVHVLIGSGVKFKKKTFDCGETGWFDKEIKNALEGDFHSAQSVVNSLMLIVLEDEIGVPRRRLMTQFRNT